MDHPNKRKIDPEKQQQLLQMNRQLHGVLLAGVLAALVLIFGLINILKAPKEFSENENRMLQSYPAFSVASVLNGSFMDDLQSAVTDQFFARDGWITSKLRFDRLLGRKVSNGVYLCKDDYLMEIPVKPDPDVLDRTLQAMTAFAERNPELKMSAMIVPNAASVMKDYLPKNAPVYNQNEGLFRIAQTLSPKMQFIDVTHALTTHAKEGVFYRTDHHWTTLGAYYAFLAGADALGIENPVTEYNIHVLADDFVGTLASKSGKHGTVDTVTAYEPVGSEVNYYVVYESTQEKAGSVFAESALQSKDKYTLYFGGNHPIVDIRTTANNDRVLLLFKDSYANCFVPFLIPYYQEIIMVDPRYYYDAAELLITQRSATDALFLYNLNTFSADTSLADALAPAVMP